MYAKLFRDKYGVLGNYNFFHFALKERNLVCGGLTDDTSQTS